jgi:hypothetical protein
VTGDGRPDWVLKNGFRLLKACDHDRAKLFEHRNPAGFASGTPCHPFVDLAWDLDGKAESARGPRSPQPYGATPPTLLYLVRS